MRGILPQLLRPPGVEERVQFQQLNHDGGPPGGKVSVADVRVVLPDGRHIPGVFLRFPAENGQVCVAEESTGVVPLLRPVVRGEPDQSRYFRNFLRRHTRRGQATFGQPGGLFLILARDSLVHGVVEPGRQQHRPGRIRWLGEQVKRFEHREQVGAAVIVAVRFAPAVQQVQEQGTVAGQNGSMLRTVSEENSVTDVLGKVMSGEADAGLVYATDVRTAAADVDEVPFPEAAGVPNSYPIAALAGGRGPAAGAFLDLVTSPEGQQVLARAGFAAPPGTP